MSKLLVYILVGLCSCSTWASVVRGAVHDHIDKSGVSQSLRASVPNHAALPQVQLDIDEHQVPHKVKPTKAEFANCQYLLIGIVFMCCCGGIVPMLVGEKLGPIINLAVWIGMFAYLFSSGIYTAWWHGEAVGMTCRIVCWTVLILLAIWSCCFCCACCCLGIVFGAQLAIKNVVVKEMRKKYEEKVKDLSGPRQEYYESEVFREKSYAMFDKADVDGSGKLDMREFHDIIRSMVGEENAEVAPLLAMCFDENFNGEVEREEFVEMMKFLSVMQIQDGRFTEEQAYEVLCLPQGATMDEVNKAHRKLSLKYHPDKAYLRGASRESATKDQGEINDAKQVLEKHLKPQANN